MIVVYSGKLKVQDEEESLAIGKCAVFEIAEDREEELRFQSLEDNTRFIMLAGKPIGEEVRQYGPFVMSSEEELGQAFDDY